MTIQLASEKEYQIENTHHHHRRRHGRIWQNIKG